MPVRPVTFDVFTLATGSIGFWVSASGIYDTSLQIGSQEGTSVAGRLGRLIGPGSLESDTFAGTIGSDGQVRLRLGRGDATLVGSLVLAEGWFNARLLLKYVGGPYDGQTLTLRFYEPY